MNDPLKKYIDHHRDDFDHLTPSADIFSKIKQELNHPPVKKTNTLRLIVSRKWLAAASILIVLSVSLLLFSKSITKDNAKLPSKGEQAKILQDIDPAMPTQTQKVFTTSAPTTKKRKALTHKSIPNQTNMSSLYADLADSSSSNTRLSAILKIQKSKAISYDAVDRLAATLSHDSNSNVRLAALNVLSQYAKDAYVSNSLLQSFSHQNDPLVQIGMMDLLREIDNPTLDGRLYALANDPNTLGAVKEQAYYILLNQNKL